MRKKQSMNIFAWHIIEWLHERFLLCEIPLCGIGILILLRACGRGMQRECVHVTVCTFYPSIKWMLLKLTCLCLCTSLAPHALCLVANWKQLMQLTESRELIHAHSRTTYWHPRRTVNFPDYLANLWTFQWLYSQRNFPWGLNTCFICPLNLSVTPT